MLMRQRRNSKSAEVAIRPRVGSGADVVSPRRLVEVNLAETLVDDEPTVNVRPQTPGHVLTALVFVYQAAASAYEATYDAAGPRLAAAAEQVRSTRSRARDVRDRAASAATARAELEARRATIVRLLGGRLRRTRLQHTLALVLLGAIVIGEVFLNASAAVAAGDPVILSIVEFLGIGAATVAVGFLGSQLRHVSDQLRYEDQPPKEALDAHLGHFWHPTHRVRTLFLGVALVIVVVTLTLGGGVAALRVSGYENPLFGLFTAITMIGAATLAFWIEDPIADLLESTDRRLATMNTELERYGEIAAQAEAARGAQRELVREVRHSAQAQWTLVTAEGLAGLMKQPHKMGDSIPERFILTSYQEWKSGTWKSDPGASGSVRADSSATAPVPGALHLVPGPETDVEGDKMSPNTQEGM